MSEPRVLVIYKRTTYQRYRAAKSEHVKELITAGHPSVAKLIEAHEAHLDSLASTRQALKRLGTQATFAHRHEPREEDEWDLVVTLGGDGTLLWASHLVGSGTPMLALNSSPETSVGYFCAGERGNLEGTLEAALAGDLKATKLTRMRVDIDGKVAHTRVLNDVLFCHECPAATTRYLLTRGDDTEEQMSSGIWAGPAAGSTAAQRSAGGRVLPIGSQRLQYVVREPYRKDAIRFRHEKDIFGKTPDDDLTIVSKIREGRLYFDGANRVLSVDVGAEIRFTRSDEKLTLLGLRRTRRPAGNDDA